MVGMTWLLRLVGISEGNSVSRIVLIFRIIYEFLNQFVNCLFMHKSLYVIGFYYFVVCLVGFDVVTKPN